VPWERLKKALLWPPRECILLKGNAPTAKARYFFGVPGGTAKVVPFQDIEFLDRFLGANSRQDDGLARACLRKMSD
jgi:hypothetical protein